MAKLVPQTKKQKLHLNNVSLLILSQIVRAGFLHENLCLPNTQDMLWAWLVGYLSQQSSAATSLCPRNHKSHQEHNDGEARINQPHLVLIFIAFCYNAIDDVVQSRMLSILHIKSKPPIGAPPNSLPLPRPISTARRDDCPTRPPKPRSSRQSP